MQQQVKPIWNLITKMSTAVHRYVRAINKYMRGFNVNNYELASDAVMHLYNGGKMSQADAYPHLESISTDWVCIKIGYKRINSYPMVWINGGMGGYCQMMIDVFWTWKR